MPQPATTEPSDLEIANQRNLRRLVLSVQASLHKLNLLIAICDNPLYRDQLIRTYEAELTAKGIACYQVQLDRQQPSLKQILLDWRTHTPNWQPETPTLVTVRGGDELLSIRLQQPKSAQERFFFSAQWTREGLRDFPFPIVLWVTETVAQGLAQQAPDFWSWRGGVFEFVQPMAWQVSDYSREDRLSVPPPAPPAPLADPAELEQQIATLQAEDPDSPLLASLYQSLGETYYKRLEQGVSIDRAQETEKAIAAFQSAIAHYEALNDRVPLATSLGYLANLYFDQGRYGEAEPLYRRALTIGEQQLGKDHPAVASSLNNLARLYYSQGHYAEAELLLQRALTIGEQQLGKDHPAVATALNNLAELYRAKGRYAEAEPLVLRTLAIWEQQLGKDHPTVVTSLNNLAGLYKAQRRYAEAEPLYLRALSIGEQQLGGDHPAVATALNNLAGLYQAQERYAEAEPLVLRTLAIWEQQLGKDHPIVATSLNNLAELYRAKGRYAEAEPLYLRALFIDEQQLGGDHSDVATSLNNLALLYKAQGRYAEAEPLYLRALAILFQQLGENHPNTQTCRQNFRHFIAQVLEAGQTAQLSDHPLTQDLLRQIQEGRGEEGE